MAKGSVPRMCVQCGAEFLAPAGNVITGGGKYCSRVCHHASMRTPAWHLYKDGRWKERAEEYKKRHAAKFPERQAARRAIHDAVRDGRLRRGPCGRCGRDEGKTHAHHHDYGKALDVVWLCASCHAAQHAIERFKGKMQRKYGVQLDIVITTTIAIPNRKAG